MGALSFERTRDRHGRSTHVQFTEIPEIAVLASNVIPLWAAQLSFVVVSRIHTCTLYTALYCSSRLLCTERAHILLAFSPCMHARHRFSVFALQYFSRKWPLPVLPTTSSSSPLVSFISIPRHNIPRPRSTQLLT